MLLAAFDAAVDPLTEIVAGHTKSVLARLTPKPKEDAVVEEGQSQLEHRGDGTREVAAETCEGDAEDIDGRVVGEGISAGEVGRRILADVGWRPEEHWAVQSEVLRCVEADVSIVEGGGSGAVGGGGVSNTAEETQVRVEERRFAEVRWMGEEYFVIRMEQQRLTL